MKNQKKKEKKRERIKAGSFFEPRNKKNETQNSDWQKGQTGRIMDDVIL